MTTDKTWEIGDNWGDVSAEQTDVLDAITDVQRLQLKPGDTIVLLTEKTLMIEQKAQMTSSMHALFPGHRVLVLDNGAQIAVVGEGPL